MRDTKKISELLGVKKSEKMREGSRHEDLEGDEIPLAKLVMKEGEKPGKFLLPHGMILFFGGCAFSWRIIPKAFRIKAPLESWNYQLFFVPKLPEGLLQKPRVVCGINACDNRPMHRGSRRVSTDVQHPGVQLTALHSVAGR